MEDGTKSNERLSTLSFAILHHKILFLLTHQQDIYSLGTFKPLLLSTNHTLWSHLLQRIHFHYTSDQEHQQWGRSHIFPGAGCWLAFAAISIRASKERPALERTSHVPNHRTRNKSHNNHISCCVFCDFSTIKHKTIHVKQKNFSFLKLHIDFSSCLHVPVVVCLILGCIQV